MNCIDNCHVAARSRAWFGSIKAFVGTLAISLFLSGSSNAQDWLTDQSFRPTTPAKASVPAVPAAAQVAASDAGLLEPPPPIAELPPTVFEQPAELPPADPAMRWYQPWTWMSWEGWKNSAELGVNGTDGNSQTFSFQTGARFKRKTEEFQRDLRITYNKTDAGGVETQNNALALVDMERFLGESKWSYFVKSGLEYDEFKAFDLRINVNTGLSYALYRTDDLTLIGRFGAGASKEYGGPDENWAPEALFGGDYEHQITKRHKLITRIDYYPEWEDFNQFRLIADASWEYLLDEDGNLSLKLGANDRYDSTPNGRKANDVNYSLLLLYKF